MNKEARNSKCPMCGYRCRNVNNIYLHMAQMATEGEIEGDDEPRKSHDTQADPKCSLTFEDNGKSRKQWLYLSVNVTMLGEDAKVTPPT